MTEQTANNAGVKSIDVSRVVRHLNANFRAVTQRLGKKNEKGTKLYQLQVDFAHLINEIQNGFEYMMPKYISEANALIADVQLEALKAEKQAKAAKAG